MVGAQAWARFCRLDQVPEDERLTAASWHRLPGRSPRKKEVSQWHVPLLCLYSSLSWNRPMVLRSLLLKSVQPQSRPEWLQIQQRLVTVPSDSRTVAWHCHLQKDLWVMPSAGIVASDHRPHLPCPVGWGVSQLLPFFLTAEGQTHTVKSPVTLTFQMVLIKLVNLRFPLKDPKKKRTYIYKYRLNPTTWNIHFYFATSLKKTLINVC